MEAWYAAYTKARMEKWARSNLWERGFEVYLPLYQKQRRHARKVDWVSSPLFPRYLFVRADLEAGHRRSITGAPGIEYLVAFGERPAAVPMAVVDEIRRREDENGYVNLCEPCQLAPGDTVRLESGVFMDKMGLFQQMADKERIIVLLQLMGRPVNVKVPASSVSPVS
jgi:transcriptional antiterminator RfaH